MGLKFPILFNLSTLNSWLVSALHLQRERPGAPVHCWFLSSLVFLDGLKL